MAAFNYSLGQLAELIDAQCLGNPEIQISGLATLACAQPGQLAFLSSPKYEKDLLATTASAVIVSSAMVAANPVNSLLSANPYLSYAKASQLFAFRPATGPGIHPSAVVSPSASVHPSAIIGPHVSIAEHSVVGANTVISAGCAIGEHSSIGDDCLLHANVSIYHGISIGDRVTIHSATVIGSDGFGYAPSPDKERGGWVKIAQLGGVIIGDDVEIGSGTTIDRGALENTLIANRVIIDNQVHLAHNVEIGENTAIAGCVGMAGSSKIGKNCTVAGAVAITGHISIADNVHISGMSMVTKSIDSPGHYSSGTPLQESKSWRKSAVRFSQLDRLVKRVSTLEKITRNPTE